MDKKKKKLPDLIVEPYTEPKEANPLIVEPIDPNSPEILRQMLGRQPASDDGLIVEPITEEDLYQYGAPINNPKRPTDLIVEPVIGMAQGGQVPNIMDTLKKLAGFGPDVYEARRKKEELDESIANGEMALPFGGVLDKMALPYGGLVGKELEDTANKQLAAMQAAKSPQSIAANKSASRSPASMADSVKVEKSAASSPDEPLKIDPSILQQQKSISPYGDDLSDAALAQAQQAGENQRMTAGFLRAGNTLGQALTNGRVKADNSFAEQMEKQAGQDVTDIVNRREAKDKDLNRQKNLMELSNAEEMNKADSPVSISVREGLKQLFPKIKIPDNVSAQQLVNMGINFGTLIAAKENADARREAFAQRAQDRADLLELKKEEKAKLEPKQSEKVNEFETSIDSMRNAISLLGNNSNWVGLVDGAVPDKVVSGDQTAFRAAIGMMADAYRQLITGAGASDKEIIRLAGRLPNEYDTYDQFQKKAKQFIDTVERGRSRYVNNLEKLGKNVSQYKQYQPLESSNKKILVSNGKETREIDPSDLAYAEKDGYSRVK
jgi:hypothetical protein